MTRFFMRQRWLPAMLFALCAGLPAGCASPDTAFYTLVSRSGPVVPHAPRIIKLRRTGLAGYLNRAEIVQDRAGERLHLASFAQWGEPLDATIGRVLAEDLSQRLPGSAIFSETGAIAAAPDATVETDIQRFDADDHGTLTLVGQVAISLAHSTGNRKPLLARTVRLSVPLAGHTPADLADGMSVLLGQMADGIAVMLQAL